MAQKKPETITRQAHAARDYTWQPDQMEINRLLLALGRDVTAANYFSDLDQVLKRLYGLRICFIAALSVRWPPALLAKVGVSMAGPYEEGLMRDGLVKLDRNVRLALVKVALEDDADAGVNGVFEAPIPIEAHFAPAGG
ncbi:MAG: hypothetical protein IPH30_17035 [Betaproteobacteria bacterium]|nr:hypothetical protein [Betaproteobacteria bacterium]